MRYKAILETSFAFSRTFNPHNIEYCWYALWDQTLSDMVADVPNLIVAPQFPVWVVPGAADEEDENDGDNPEEIVQMKEQPEEAAQEGSSDQTDDEKEDENEVGNISFASTVPQKDAKGVLVDFAILNLMAVAQPLHTERYGGWRITAASVGLLIEVKRFPSRSLEAEDQKSEIIERINEAREDVVQQAGYLFLHDTKMNSVMAIAAAGPYWSGTTIYRGDVKQTMYGLGTRDPSYQPPKEKYPDVTLEWNVILRVIPTIRETVYTLYIRLYGRWEFWMSRQVYDVLSILLCKLLPERDGQSRKTSFVQCHVFKTGGKYCSSWSH